MDIVFSSETGGLPAGLHARMIKKIAFTRFLRHFGFKLFLVVTNLAVFYWHFSYLLLEKDLTNLLRKMLIDFRFDFSTFSRLISKISSDSTAWSFLALCIIFSIGCYFSYSVFQEVMRYLSLIKTYETKNNSLRINAD